MKRLILTNSSGTSLMRSDFAEVVLPFTFRFIGGPLPSPEELATYVAARSDKHKPGSHWSHWWRHAHKTRKYLRLIEFCQPYDTIELWFDPDLNDQLQLIWLLDFFKLHPEPERPIDAALAAQLLARKNDGHTNAGFASGGCCRRR